MAKKTSSAAVRLSDGDPRDGASPMVAGVPRPVFNSLAEKFGQEAATNALFSMQLADAADAAKTNRGPRLEARMQKAAVGPVAVSERPPEESDAKLAPWPYVDRYQVVLGSSLTLDVISSLLRTCSTGYRTFYVDLLEELLEREPHGYAVLQQRILAVAGARMEFTPADLPEGDPRAELAKQICEFVESAFKAIPDRVQALVDLLWGLYYAVSASEVTWRRDDAGRRVPARLHFIHSRRLNYPSWEDWDVRVWDQGAVRGSLDAFGGPTQQVFGIRIKDYPGRFICHTPRVRGSYPTRDGLGRQLVWWFALKGMAARSAAVYIERFAKPWPVGYYQTGQKKDQPRAANTRDIAVLQATTLAMGIGTGSSATLPDSVKVDMYGPGGATGAKGSITHVQLLEYFNGEISKVVLGQTLTTESGKRGNTSATDVHKQGQKEINRYDAACLCETLKRDLVYWIVRFNFPDAEDLVPNLRLMTDEDPDPNDIADVVVKAVTAGLPVDADAAAEAMGVTLVPNEEKGKDGKPAHRRAVLAAPLDPSRVDGADLADPPEPPAPVGLPGQKPGIPGQGGGKAGPAAGKAPAGKAGKQPPVKAKPGAKGATAPKGAAKVAAVDDEDDKENDE